MTSGTRLDIAGSRLSASISTLGAELWTLADAEGRSLLSDGDPAFWTGRAPLLFPVVGRLRNDTYRLGDRTFTLPQHGFARDRAFEVVEAGPDAATFRLADDAESRAVYPFAFRLDVTYRIDSGRLETTAVLENTGGAAMPASFGFHPAFRWPLPYGRPRAGHAIWFEADEPGPIHRADAKALIAPEPRPTPVVDRRLDLTDALFEEGAVVFLDPASRRVVYGVAGAPRLAVDFPDTPHLAVWSKPGAPFVCVEPWQGYADPVGFDGEIWDKPGMLRLEPGEIRRWRLVIELER